jgi:hypothetical protein
MESSIEVISRPMAPVLPVWITPAMPHIARSSFVD